MNLSSDDEQIIDTSLTIAEIIDSRENPSKILKQAEAFQYMMLEYGAALKIVETKLDALEKMHRRGLPISIESIQRTLTDIAGARVICSFLDDIYTLADMIEKQEDITVHVKKDYIAHPKENGYRSLHLIVSIPIYLSQGRKDIPVEIQFRTIAMEFWATLEHKIKYKKKIADPESVSAELKSCADLINEIDHRMQSLRRRTID